MGLGIYSKDIIATFQYLQKKCHKIISNIKLLQRNIRCKKKKNYKNINFQEYPRQNSQ